MSQLKLGVMTLYINNQRQIDERSFYRRLFVECNRMGINAFLFTPEDVDHQRMRIYAVRYDHRQRKWIRYWTEFPDLIFDRCRYQATERFTRLREFRSRYPQLHYMNRPLSNKWLIHRLFSQNPLIADHLPDTKLFKNGRSLLQFLSLHRTVFLKPVNGTGGRGILRIEKIGRATYQIRGRDAHRRIITEQTLDVRTMLRKAYAWTSGRKYLMQQGIDISLNNGRVHDFRMLVQKDGTGVWKITGCAGRIGAQNSVTSNLHGGGRAIEMDRLLNMRFNDEERIGQIQDNSKTLAMDIVDELEQEYGRLCELALDLAVDRDGKVWLIEINPKPGRNIFLQINDLIAYRTAIARPLEYAKWLHKKLNKPVTR